MKTERDRAVGTEQYTRTSPSAAFVISKSQGAGVAAFAFFIRSRSDVIVNFVVVVGPTSLEFNLRQWLQSSSACPDRLQRKNEFSI